MHPRSSESAVRQSRDACWRVMPSCEYCSALTANAIAAAIRKIMEPGVLASLSAASKPAGLTLDEFGIALSGSKQVTQ